MNLIGILGAISVTQDINQFTILPDPQVHVGWNARFHVANDKPDPAAASLKCAGSRLEDRPHFAGVSVKVLPAVGAKRDPPRLPSQLPLGNSRSLSSPTRAPVRSPGPSVPESPAPLPNVPPRYRWQRPRPKPNVPDPTQTRLPLEITSQAPAFGTYTLRRGDGDTDNSRLRVLRGPRSPPQPSH
jgi:hypothetical protein